MVIPWLGRVPRRRINIQPPQAAGSLLRSLFRCFVATGCLLQVCLRFAFAFGYLPIGRRAVMLDIAANHACGDHIADRANIKTIGPKLTAPELLA
jgi:hypothetical protein